MSKKETVTETKETVVTEEPAVVVTEKKLKKSAPEKPSNVSVMYVGPTIERIVQHSTVFKNGVLPEPLKKLIEEAPYVKKLLVPIDALPAAMKELNQKDSALNVISKKVKNIRR